MKGFVDEVELKNILKAIVDKSSMNKLHTFFLTIDNETRGP